MLKLFSERNKTKSANEVFIFDELPKKLRIQLKFIVEDILNEHEYHKIDFEIHKTLCEEYGKLSLSSQNPLGRHDKQTILELFIYKPDVSIIFDVIELALRYHYYYMTNYEYKFQREIAAKEINEIEKIINIRFKESFVGYNIVNGEIIRIDSEATFKEIIEPTINLTANKLFENVNIEYIEAIKSYQKGDNKNCLIKCSNSFESTLKIICDEKRWEYENRDTSSKLIEICYENNLIPPKMQSSFSSLRSLLESGISPIRNHYAGHGKGKEKVIVEDYLARYALNITGSSILFLIETSGL